MTKSQIPKKKPNHHIAKTTKSAPSIPSPISDSVPSQAIILLVSSPGPHRQPAAAGPRLFFSSPSTMQFSTFATLSALTATAFAAYSNDTTSAAPGSNETVVTTDITVTGYTTYCPESTVITITKCSDVCEPSAVTVTEATTLTFTEPCLVPTTYTTHVTEETTIPCTECEHKTTKGAESATTSAPASVSSAEGAAAKNVAGVFAGVAAVAAALM
ncbi:hypothetical protein FOB63_000455 [Clavispora lusitaniae]|nr:hypothetical protein FOB63_000455 [Clavispora lusitaniae]